MLQKEKCCNEDYVGLGSYIITLYPVAFFLVHFVQFCQGFNSVFILSGIPFKSLFKKILCYLPKDIRINNYI